MAVALAVVALRLVVLAVLLVVGPESTAVASSAHGLSEVVAGAAAGTLARCVNLHCVGIDEA